jgi:hypothetical protein
MLSLASLGQNWQWVKQFNSSKDLDIYDVKLSESGNVYVTGSYISNFILGGVGYDGYPSSASTVQDVFFSEIRFRWEHPLGKNCWKFLTLIIQRHWF